MVALLLVVRHSRPAGAADYDEGSVKTALIGKIAGFITWPEDAGLARSDRRFDVVIVGQTPLESLLIAYYGRVSIAGHRVQVRVVRDPSELGRPHLVFFASSVTRQLERWLTELGDAAVLTVADTPGFCRRGVGINLILIDNHIQFEVSRKALRRQRLQASYRLLALARLVDESWQEEGR